MSEDRQYILSIDQGTSSTRAILFDDQGHIVRIAQKELDVLTPHDGWVEQDANQIWYDVIAVCNELMNGGDEVPVTIGITNQRETTIVWDKNTGKPMYNAIVWQDRRTSAFCNQLKHDGKEEQIQSITGLVVDPYFSATKIRWILDQSPEGQERAERGDLLFGTVESYLIWKLSNGQDHKTDVTNACRTMLMNTRDGEWSDDMCELFNIPKKMLPKIEENTAHFTNVRCDDIQILKDITVHGCAGDQQAALFGQACFQKGMIKSTYGTGCFALVNVGEDYVESSHNLLSTIAWAHDGETIFALEGSIFVAGAAIQFLRDNLEFIEDAKETEEIALSVEDTAGVYFVPALTGLGAPHWSANTRGAIFGLNRGTGKAHIVRATLDAQAYQTKDLLDAMAQDMSENISEMRVDGGLVRNGYICETIAKICNVNLRLSSHVEAPAWGAASLAGLGIGLYKSLDEIEALWQSAETYQPNEAQSDSNSECYDYDQWKNYVASMIV
jgi:glycerol kinase